MAEDAYLGDAQFTVSVDNNQIGGVQTVTALKANGASQLFDINGNFGAGTHTVTVDFLNDLYAGTPSTDRNLYMLSASYDGLAASGANLAFLSAGSQTISVGQAVVSQPATPAATGTTTIGSGSDTVQLKLAEDAYLGNAQFTVSVDGTQIGGTQTATTLLSSGSGQTFNVEGNFGAGTHTVSVDFLNDAYGGTAATDRNLYVLAASYDGVAASPGTLTLDSAGTQSLTVGQAAVTTPVTTTPATTTTASTPATTATTTVGSGSDTVELQMAEDYYLGNAQFTMSVDGVQIGGTQTVTAIHGSGAPQVFDFKGNFGTGTHTVAIDFLNDAYGGSTTTDRNLYLVKATYDGVEASGDSLSLLSTGSQSITVGLAAATAAMTTTPTTTTTTTTTNPSSQTVQPTSSTSSLSLALFGVNLSGAEYGSATAQNPGTEGTDYVMPSNSEIDYYASKGMNVIRLPFLWERMQPVQNGPLNQTYLSQIDSVVNYAASKGIKVDLDLHNYGFGYGNEVGSSGTPASSLDNLWSQVASHYASNSNVIFGIMNEPYAQSAQDWATTEETAVKAIRSTGATSQEILASGTGYDGGSSWVSSGNAAVLASTVIDPNHNMAFEVHTYFDSDGSGTSSSVVSPTIGVDRLTDVTNWAKTNGVKLFLGETGAASDPASLTTLSNTLAYVQQNNDVWQGGTYWAGGAWWGSYPFSVEPANGVDKPQMAILSNVAHGQLA